MRDEVYTYEAMLVGVLWNKPEIFDMYNEERLSTKHILNKNWSFFLGLARHMYKKDIEIFDDIIVSEVISELNLGEKYESYGGYKYIEELMAETSELIDNFEGYFNEVKKYSLLKELGKLFGDKVLEVDGAYDYKKLKAEHISVYWSDKLANIDLAYTETTIEAENLLEGLDELVDELDESNDMGMPLFNAKKLSSEIAGMKRGQVTITGSFSGRGKTSFIIEKYVMSCIMNREKLLIIANEQTKKDFQKMLIITAMNTYDMYKTYQDHFTDVKVFNRKKLNTGGFTVEEKAKFKMAVEWIKSLTQGNDALIKFVSVEDFTLDVVEKIIRKWEKRGYYNILIDTMKPTEGGKSASRWEQFVLDFDKIYKLSRANGGGLNLCTVVTIQLADTSVNDFWLDDSCYGESKKIKNVVDKSIVFRPCFPSEYEGGADEIEVINYVKRSDEPFNQDITESKELGEDKEYIKKKSKLQVGKTYYALFILKNRDGGATLTGGVQPIIYEVQFNQNRWIEKGFAQNIRTTNGRKW